MWKYFKEWEVQGLSNELIGMLDKARDSAEIPFIITSGYRDPDQNDIAGGVSDSSHLTGEAVDLKCHTGRLKYIMLPALLQVGFNRIGIYDQHIHVDIDQTKSPNVIWIGKSK